MAWNPGWDKVFEQNEWGKYPPEEAVRTVSRAFKDIAAAKRKGIKILEIGCGPGANLWFLARDGYGAYGIDGSDVAIRRAKVRLANDHLKAKLTVGDAMAMPYEDNFFDCVLDIECLYANTMKDSKAIIEEVKRVLKPGGLFISKTFMTGSYGDGKGERHPTEANTFTKICEGAFHQGYGVIRFTSEEDIKDLYSPFVIDSVDYIIRSDKNRKHEVKEWVIVCHKGGKSHV